MILSYCLNPDCPSPQNPPHLKYCQACGSELILRGRYRAVKKIGKGGFGSTFLCVDLSLPGNPLCVVKQLKVPADDKEDFEMALELFAREAKTLGKLDHPQIPRLLDYFEQDKRFYLVQTWVKGDNLQQEVKKNGVFTEKKLREFLEEILQVLKYVHSQKIIHRDIKPANIIRREQDGRLVLIDFGAVKDEVNSQLAAKYHGKTALTQFAVGTMGYAPPEQLAMRPFYSSDIYALGATCLYLLTGKSPKDFPVNENTGELAWRESVNISKGLESILSRMLEVDIRNRYKSAEEVLRDLELIGAEGELRQGLVIQSSPPPAKPKTANAADDSSSDTSYASPTARLARAIRARKSRQGKTGQVVAIPVTVETILLSYGRGKRDFSGQNLNGFDFSGQEIPGINFHHCQLKGASFEGSNLKRANFYAADLKGANFYKARLKYGHFLKADLQGADLREADLRLANLEGAILMDTNLCGADLTGATVTEEQLAQAITNWNTIFPDGKKRLFG